MGHVIWDMSYGTCHIGHVIGDMSYRTCAIVLPHIVRELFEQFCFSHNLSQCSLPYSIITYILDRLAENLINNHINIMYICRILDI